MENRQMKSTLIIVTYIFLLVLLLVQFDTVIQLCGLALSAMTPFFIGFAIAFVLHRPCNYFERKLQNRLRGKSQRFARGIAVSLSYVILIVSVLALFAFVLPKVGESIGIFVAGLSGYLDNVQGWVNQFVTRFQVDALKNLQIDYDALNTHLRQALESALGVMSGAGIHLVTMTGTLVSTVVTLVLAVVFSIYMLAGGKTLCAQCGRLLQAYVPQPWAGRVERVVNISAVTFTNFVTGQLTEACIIGGLCAVGMLFIYADYAPLIGIIVGVSALIPVAGAYLGAIVSALLLVMVTPMGALIFLVFLTVLQQIEGNIIYPRVVGTSIGLPGIWVLAAVTVGGSLFGLLGVLLSVPVVSVLYTLLRLDVSRRLQEKASKEIEE